MHPVELASLVLALKTLQSLWPERFESGKTEMKHQLSLQTFAKWSLDSTSSLLLQAYNPQGMTAISSLCDVSYKMQGKLQHQS